MGHDVYAYEASNKSDDRPEIAYLRRSAFDNLARAIYKVLDATACDCGYSGCGNEMTFTQAQLVAALARIPADIEELEPERGFLRDCIRQGGYVNIAFH